MIKRIVSLIVTLLLAFSLTSCGGEEYLDQVIYGMDTYITVRLSSEASDGSKISEERFSELCDECAYIIAKNERLMSSHDEDAQIYGINSGGVSMILSPNKELLSVLRAAEDMEEKTDGAFSYTLGALTELWNVSGGGPVPSDEAIAEALLHTNSSSVEFSEEKIAKSDADCKIDLGGIAKGHTAQELVEYLASEGVSYGLVSVSSSIGVFGSKDDASPFKVGLTDPSDTSGVAGYLSIHSGFISVSGSYERYFEENGQRYHHIIDPATGCPADSDIVSVAVWANNGSVADALSTSLFVMGVDGTSELYRSGEIDFEAVIITEGGEIILTDGIAEEDFELANDKYTVRKSN